MIEIKRIIKSGFLSFKRNRSLSSAAILMMTITLSVITALIILQAVLTTSLNQVKDKVDVTIYFNTTAPEEKILTLKNYISKLPEVAEITYTSSADALKIFRERHTNDYTTIAALDEIKENPLGAYLNIKAKEISQYESIANFLKSESALSLDSDNIIDKVNYYQNKAVIEKLNSIISGAKKLGSAITLILIFISIIITFNTMRLIIFIAKEEIGVMRLVGASKARVSGPFLFGGAFYGLISTIITLLLFWPGVAWLGRNMTNFLGMNVYDYFVSNLFQIFFIILLSGVLLGMFSSFLATRKYLNR